MRLNHLSLLFVGWAQLSVVASAFHVEEKSAKHYKTRVWWRVMSFSWYDFVASEIVCVSDPKSVFSKHASFGFVNILCWGRTNTMFPIERVF